MKTSSADAGYEAVFRAEHRAIVQTAYLITGNQETAQEVAQDAFAELFARWRKIGRYDKPGAWVRRVAIRKAVKLLKRQARMDPRPLRDTPAGVSERVSIDTLRALEQLSPTQRAVVVLHYFQGLPVQEAAEAIGCKPATASVHLHRARARLADLLGEPIDEEVETDANR